MPSKKQMLEEGAVFWTKERGDSMSPKLKSGQEHLLEPCDWEQADIGDIVYCKVGRHYYTHLVTAKSAKGCQISNNKGYTNGWTKKVFGRVIDKE